MFLKKFWKLVALGAVLAMCSLGCVAGYDQYGRPIIVDPLAPIYAYPAYPVDVYPYCWGGYYYYPYWTGTVWDYRVYSRPIPNWVGPPLRHNGPAPRYWGGVSHHGNIPTGHFQQGVPMIGRSQPQVGQPQFHPGSASGHPGGHGPGSGMMGRGPNAGPHPGPSQARSRRSAPPPAKGGKHPPQPH
jgi:hypothetical protein